jgi:hypothetical protein
VFIEVDRTFPTAKARIASYVAFKRDLGLCGDTEELDTLLNEYEYTFERLKEEKRQGYDWHDYDYLESMQNALEAQRQKISLTIYFTEK